MWGLLSFGGDGELLSGYGSPSKTDRDSGHNPINAKMPHYWLITSGEAFSHINQTV